MSRPHRLAIERVVETRKYAERAATLRGARGPFGGYGPHCDRRKCMFGDHLKFSPEFGALELVMSGAGANMRWPLQPVERRPAPGSVQKENHLSNSFVTERQPVKARLN